MDVARWQPDVVGRGEGGKGSQARRAEAFLSSNGFTSHVDDLGIPFPRPLPCLVNFLVQQRDVCEGLAEITGVMCFETLACSGRPLGSAESSTIGVPIMNGGRRQMNCS
jgi:hypothetical protein